jgi:mycofactocin precursor
MGVSAERVMRGLHLPDRPGGTARSGSYRRVGSFLCSAGRAFPAGQKGLDEMTEDSPQQQEENVGYVNELLIEEVSIDGMCGVY